MLHTLPAATIVALHNQRHHHWYDWLTIRLFLGHLNPASDCHSPRHKAAASGTRKLFHP